MLTFSPRMLHLPVLTQITTRAVDLLTEEERAIYMRREIYAYGMVNDTENGARLLFDIPNNEIAQRITNVHLFLRERDNIRLTNFFNLTGFDFRTMDITRPNCIIKLGMPLHTRENFPNELIVFLVYLNLYICNLL